MWLPQAVLPRTSQNLAFGARSGQVVLREGHPGVHTSSLGGNCPFPKWSPQLPPPPAADGRCSRCSGGASARACVSHALTQKVHQGRTECASSAVRGAPSPPGPAPELRTGASEHQGARRPQDGRRGHRQPQSSRNFKLGESQVASVFGVNTRVGARASPFWTGSLW